MLGAEISYSATEYPQRAQPPQRQLLAGLGASPIQYFIAFKGDSPKVDCPTRGFLPPLGRRLSNYIGGKYLFVAGAIQMQNHCIQNATIGANRTEHLRPGITNLAGTRPKWRLQRRTQS